MTIPRELERSAPRTVQLSAQGKVMIALAFLLVVGGLTGAAFLHVKAQGDEARAELRASTALRARGTITSAERRKGKGKRWNMDYSFDTERTVSTGRLIARDKLEPGSSVTVGYLPSNPSDNWVVGHEPRGGLFWLGPLLGSLSLLGGALCVWQLRRQMDLLSRGRAAVAKALASKKVRHQHGAYYRVKYEFRTINGAVREGKLDSTQSIEEGAEFVIVYDPDQPKRTARYPMSLVKI